MPDRPTHYTDMGTHQDRVRALCSAWVAGARGARATSDLLAATCKHCRRTPSFRLAFATRRIQELQVERDELAEKLAAVEAESDEAESDDLTIRLADAEADADPDVSG